MRNQIKYFAVYLCVLSLLVVSLLNIANARTRLSDDVSQSTAVEMSQAELDQILAPIALYPDTLLSHILVASTYPLEVIQAARWRAANEDLDEQQALDATDSKDWDPSVKALVPFHDLLQTLSQDLDWLQTLGSAFLINESRLLASVQNLRQKAYQQGNLEDNQYVTVAQEDDQIIIETVRKEVVYVPYYDTRVVYGNWWWNHHQPTYWHRPRHSLFSTGLYWSIGFNIRPSFYFGGFHWHNRHVVANYHYHRNANRHWSRGYANRQIVKVREYPRWSHNQDHRRGVHYKYNGQKFVHKVNGGQLKQPNQQIDKRRVLNVKSYANKQHNVSQKRIKQALAKQQKSHYKSDYRSADNKRQIVEQNNKTKVRKASKDYRRLQTAKVAPKQKANSKIKHQGYSNTAQVQHKPAVKQFKKNRVKNRSYSSNSKGHNNRTSAKQHNKMKPVTQKQKSKNNRH